MREVAREVVESNRIRSWSGHTVERVISIDMISY